MSVFGNKQMKIQNMSHPPSTPRQTRRTTHDKSFWKSMLNDFIEYCVKDERIPQEWRSQIYFSLQWLYMLNIQQKICYERIWWLVDTDDDISSILLEVSKGAYYESQSYLFDFYVLDVIEPFLRWWIFINSSSSLDF